MLRNPVFLAVFLVFFSIGIRLPGVYHGLPNQFHTVTYFSDENTHITHIEAMDPSKLDFNPTSDKTPSALGGGTFHLYIYAAIAKAVSYTGWIKLVKDKNYYYSHPTEWSRLFILGRLLSALLGTGTVLLVFFAGRIWYGDITALLAAALLSIMPAHVIYSGFFLMNVPEVFLSLMSFYWLYKILKESKTKYYILAGLFAGLAVSTRFTAAPLPIMLIAAYLLSGDVNKKPKQLIIGLAIIPVAFFIGTPYAVLDYPHFLAAMRIPMRVMAGQPFSLIGNTLTVLSSLAASSGLFVLLISLAGIALALIRRSKADLITAGWSIFLIFMFLRAGESSIPGRLLPVLPYLSLLSASFMVWLYNKYRAASIVIMAMIVCSGLVFANFCVQYNSKNDIRDVSSIWLYENLPKNANIGLVREPSTMSPGIIDRKYRHPDQFAELSWQFVDLCEGGMRNKDYSGCQELKNVLPEYIVLEDVEKTMERTINESYGYVQLMEFNNTLPMHPLQSEKHLYAMLNAPGKLIVLKRKP